MQHPTLLPANVYAVILAGGSGTRFWPKSRHLQPKQLCKIGDSELTMLELTLNRLDGLVPAERRLIVTHKDQMQKTRELAGTLCANFIAEPMAKNTAPALALAALEIDKLAHAKKIAKPIIISLHADALVKNLSAFHQAVHSMVAAAQENFLGLLGITPSYPETGYGYIEKSTHLAHLGSTFKVKSFREKPAKDLADQYVKSGRFLWNSGIFAWRTDVIREELETFLPEALKPLYELEGADNAASFGAIPAAKFAAAYAKLPSIAIDPAVLEKSQRVVVLEADIGWKDVGSWDALDDSFTPDAQGNLFFGKVTAIDCEGVTVDSDAPLVACLGVKDIVVVCSEGAILVCPKDRAQDVKKIVEQLKAQGRADLT